MTDHPSAERYVAGTLNDEETARFEEAMIERPDLAADVNVRRRIKAGLSLLEERRELEGFLNTAQRQPVHRRYAAAAAVALAAIAGAWGLLLNPVSPALASLLSPSQTGNRPVTGSILLALTRAGGPPPQISVSRSGLIRLQVLADEETKEAEVALESRAAGKSAVISAKLVVTTGEQGFMDVYLDASRLQSGEFALAVTPRGGSVQRLPFNLQIID